MPLKNSLHEKLVRNATELEELLSEAPHKSRSSHDFHIHRTNLKKVQIDRALSALRKDVWEAVPLLFQANDSALLIALLSQTQGFTDYEKRLDSVRQLRALLAQVRFPTLLGHSSFIQFKLPLGVPDVLRAEMQSDVLELEKTFHAACYRACVILCGRLLEMGLHRIYFERTGFDILEKNPGIGLGTLVAKLTEKQVEFDPGLTQQIHLINQVRIYSVHKKQASFVPTKAQAQAMILYTLDILEKLFP